MKSGVKSAINLTSLRVLSFDCWSPESDEKAHRCVIYFMTTFFYCVAGYYLLFGFRIGMIGGKSAVERVLAFLRFCYSLAEVKFKLFFGYFFSSSSFCVSNLSFDCFGPGYF